MKRLLTQDKTRRNCDHLEPFIEVVIGLLGSSQIARVLPMGIFATIICDTPRLQTASTPTEEIHPIATIMLDI
jgi:hypothetical protein